MPVFPLLHRYTCFQLAFLCFYTTVFTIMGFIYPRYKRILSFSWIIFSFLCSLGISTDTGFEIDLDEVNLDFIGSLNTYIGTKPLIYADGSTINIFVTTMSGRYFIIYLNGSMRYRGELESTPLYEPLLFSQSGSKYIFIATNNAIFILSPSGMILNKIKSNPEKTYPLFYDFDCDNIIEILFIDKNGRLILIDDFLRAQEKRDIFDTMLSRTRVYLYMKIKKQPRLVLITEDGKIFQVDIWTLLFNKTGDIIYKVELLKDLSDKLKISRLVVFNRHSIDYGIIAGDTLTGKILFFEQDRYYSLNIRGHIYGQPFFYHNITDNTDRYIINTIQGEIYFVSGRDIISRVETQERLFETSLLLFDNIFITSTGDGKIIFFTESGDVIKKELNSSNIYLTDKLCIKNRCFIAAVDTKGNIYSIDSPFDKTKLYGIDNVFDITEYCSKIGKKIFSNSSREQKDLMKNKKNTTDKSSDETKYVDIKVIYAFIAAIVATQLLRRRAQD